MKVEFSSNPGYYRGKSPISTGKDTKTSVAAKTDVAEFSRGSSTLDKTLLNAKSSVQSGVNLNTDSQRLEELRQSVKNGTYTVSTRDIVSAILGS